MTDAIHTEQTPIIDVRMAVSGGEPYGTIYFITDEDNIWNEQKKMDFHVYTDGDFHIYFISMILCPNWKGIVTAIRLDPTSGPPAEIQIDYIRVQSP